MARPDRPAPQRRWRTEVRRYESFDSKKLLVIATQPE
jgi:hypothetical protein